MRAPRYRFPDEVRAVTRNIAARMLRDGSVVATADELATWISRAPIAREALEKGGYGTKFSAADLFPLLQIFAAKGRG